MLATLKELRDYLGEKGSGQDPRLTKALKRAAELINDYCGRNLESATYTDELYDGTATNTLQLNNYPIISVASIYEFGKALTVSQDPTTSPDIIWYAERGTLVRPFNIFWPWWNYYRVTYTAGYAAGSIPETLVQAALEQASLIVKEKDRIGLQSKTTGNQVVNYTRELSPMVKTAVDGFIDLSLVKTVV